MKVAVAHEWLVRYAGSERVVAELLEAFPGSRLLTTVAEPAALPAELRGAEREDWFLYVGRLVSYKRPELVVDAFRGLDARLRVVGDGHLRERLERDAPPNVEFLGEQGEEELRDLYRSARAFVYPADEDFGIVMAEVQACGTPVIGLRRGGAVDIVQDGETGWLLRRQDVAELQRAVERAAVEDLDPVAIRSNAERFASDRFREQMRRVVAEAVAGPAAEPEPEPLAAGGSA